MKIIKKINPRQDANMLARKLYFRDVFFLLNLRVILLKKCLRNFIIVNMLIKMGADAGLTLYEIGSSFKILHIFIV